MNQFRTKITASFDNHIDAYARQGRRSDCNELYLHLNVTRAPSMEPVVQIQLDLDMDDGTDAERVLEELEKMVAQAKAVVLGYRDPTDTINKFDGKA